jgi:hypothetical protein
MSWAAERRVQRLGTSAKLGRGVRCDEAVAVVSVKRAWPRGSAATREVTGWDAAGRFVALESFEEQPAARRASGVRASRVRVRRFIGATPIDQGKRRIASVPASRSGGPI